jgi:hypothetical protein
MDGARDVLAEAEAIAVSLGVGSELSRELEECRAVLGGAA